MSPDDEHPPHDVCRGEKFLESIYSAVVNGKNWEQTLLVITFDEHGGCPDHMPPPWGAVAPDPQSDPGEAGFRFDRFGVRVPAILVSPWVHAGTVFRSTTIVPYDHTSILATLRDWLSIPQELMLPSKPHSGRTDFRQRAQPATGPAGQARDHRELHSSA